MACGLGLLNYNILRKCMITAHPDSGHDGGNVAMILPKTKRYDTTASITTQHQPQGSTETEQRQRDGQHKRKWQARKGPFLGAQDGAHTMRHRSTPTAS